MITASCSVENILLDIYIPTALPSDNHCHLKANSSKQWLSKTATAQQCSVSSRLTTSPVSAGRTALDRTSRRFHFAGCWDAKCARGRSAVLPQNKAILAARSTGAVVNHGNSAI